MEAHIFPPRPPNPVLTVDLSNPHEALKGCMMMSKIFLPAPREARRDGGVDRVLLTLGSHLTAYPCIASACSTCVFSCVSVSFTPPLTCQFLVPNSSGQSTQDKAYITPLTCTVPCIPLLLFLSALAATQFTPFSWGCVRLPLPYHHKLIPLLGTNIVPCHSHACLCFCRLV